MAQSMDDRLQKLEELCTHQASELESLSDTVRQQWDRLDRLTKLAMRLRDRVTEVEEAGGGHEATKPPHY